MRTRLGAVLVCAALFVALVVGTAVARSLATTKAATSVRDRSAVLHGLVATDRTESAWFFQYGTTRDLGSQSRPRTIKAHATAVKLKKTHLRPDTTYYFRLAVIQGGYIGHASYGSIEHFKTK
jgi:hypothetical protein